MLITIARLALAVSVTVLLPAQAVTEPIIGTLLDPDGNAIAGAHVEAFRAEGDGTGLLDLEYKRSFDRVGSAPTDDDGRFAIHLPVGLPCQIRVDHAPFARFVRDDCLPGEDVPIRLEVPVVFEGKLTLHDGSAATAALRAWDRNTSTEVVRGRTDAGGRFRFDRVPAGPIRVEIAADAAPSPPWAEVELVAGRTVTHDVQLSRGVLLKGRVIDAATGEPIAGARIGEGWTLHRAVTTGADGRYELPGYGSSGYDELHCVARGYVKSVAMPKELEGDPIVVDYRLERGLGAAGRVVGPSGEPLAGIYVCVFGTVHDGTTQFHDCIGLRTDSAGRFRTLGLRGDLDHVVVVRRDGYASLVYALPPADGAGFKMAGEIRLPRPRIVRGIVLNADGAPRPRTKVCLWGYNADRHRIDPGGNLERSQQSSSGLSGWRLLDMYVGRREVRTDHQGAFAFGDVPPGEFHVVAYDERNGKIGFSERFEVAAHEDPEPIELGTDR